MYVVLHWCADCDGVSEDVGCVAAAWLHGVKVREPSLISRKVVDVYLCRGADCWKFRENYEQDTPTVKNARLRSIIPSFGADKR